MPDPTPAKKQAKKKAPKSKGTGHYVYCPHSQQHHGLFAIQVIQKIDTGNYWCKCVCGVRMHFDNGLDAIMTHKQALKAGALFPFQVIN